jgi:uncharacterized protein YjbI with pentapeptide repeats
MTDTPPERFGPPVCQDYDVDHFDGVVLSLFELFRANLIKTKTPLIQNRTFTNCVIEGPAVLLAMSGVNFDNCNLGMASEDSRSLILMPMAKNKVVGAIGLKDCTFRNCQFFAIGYTGGDAFIDRMLQVLDPQKPAADA